MLVKCLALEWGAQGIRVNGISPGPIEGTEGVERMAPGSDAKAVWASRLALKRLGTLDEIADFVAFLVSPAASYITGTILDFDGGSQLGTADSEWP
jgi:NAD(P)-dependent dehydrogenase (short-subunit alcohol dehydrogenase family)